jgi:hypothetical protein
MQVTSTDWPARAVHDTVQAVLAQRVFRRDLSQTILERLLLWFGEALHKLLDVLHGAPAGRTIVLSIAALVVVLVAARFVVAARARDGGGISFGSRTDARRREDPWHAAERLAAAGDFEGAVHALYRGVLASLQQREKLRLDPSRTSGDYVRELRRQGSAALHPFRAFARRFDAAVYGHGVCDAALFDDLRQLAGPLRERARAA